MLRLILDFSCRVCDAVNVCLGGGDEEVGRFQVAVEDVGVAEV